MIGAGYLNVAYLDTSTNDLADALAAIAGLKPDLVLLDVRRPDASGIEACRRLQSMDLGVKVLVLASGADDAFVSGAIAAGAHGCLLKETHGEGLIQAIQNVAAGKSVPDPAVTRRAMSLVRGTAPPNKLDSLSPQERRVVALVAEGKTNKEIGFQMDLSDKTVKNYLSNALEKLSLSRRSQAAALFVRYAPLA